MTSVRQISDEYPCNH